MGKPFQKEIDQVLETFKWSIQQPVDNVTLDLISNKNLPLYIVGSGGSLSACYYASLLYQQFGTMAKAVTPLELLYSKNSLKASNILFISASGANTDILHSYKTAISYEPNKVFNICTQLNSPLCKLAKENSISSCFEFNLPTGKDGFLATNSLVAFFSILHMALNKDPINAHENIFIDEQYLLDLKSFMFKVTEDFTFTILHAGWGQPVAIDIESKLAEAALANVLISDWRNFGHGRHHWFDKRISSSAIIALITPEEEKLAAKTLALLPTEIPVLRINTLLSGSLGSIELLIKSFHFINQIGQRQGIDPGRPGVPDFGSKLYHLNYQKFYSKFKDKIPETAKIAISRKADVPSFETLSHEEKTYWLKAYNSFTAKLNSTTFGSIIFDYDGTLCSAANRRDGVDPILAKLLNVILENGLVIGIATGRGQSVRSDLQKVIPEKYRNQVIIGYYNCSDFGLLNEDQFPDKGLPQNKLLEKVYIELIQQEFPVKLKFELKPHQIILEIENEKNWSKVRLSIIQFIISLNISNIQILESSHSMDIIDQTETSKVNIVKYCKEKAIYSGLSSDCLCIGDKGKWPGNDYQLLSSPFSLSVDEVSSESSSCWNLAKPGIKNIEATTYYLSSGNFSPQGLNLKIK